MNMKPDKTIGDNNMNDRLDESTSNTREQEESMITAQHEQQSSVGAAAVEKSNNPSRSHQRMRNKASAQFRRVVRNNLQESNSDTANAFSNSLVDTARNAPRPGEGRGPGSPCASSEESFSSSLSSDGGLIRRHASTAQQTSSERQEHVVTAGGDSTATNSNAPTAGTATTSNTSAPSSSGDDQTDSRVSAGGSVEREETATLSSRHEDRHHHHRHSKMHHHRHHHFRNDVRDRDDGSNLRLPSDDGSDRLSTASPAKVVAAAHMPPPRTSSSGDNSSGGEGDADIAYLLQPHHEPRYQTIRKTFSQLPKRREASKRMEASSSSEELKTSTKLKKKRKHRSRNTTTQDRLTRERSPNSSGTEEGYMGSADSKENDEESSSSPSVASSSDNNYIPKKRCRRGDDGSPKDDENVGALDNVNNGPGGADSSSSSEIADFSSGTTLENGEEDAGPLGSSRSTSPSLSSSNDEDLSSDGDYQVAYERAKSQVVEGQRGFLKASVRKSGVVVDGSEPHGAASETPWAFSGVSSVQQDAGKMGAEGVLPHIMTIGSDIMAHVLTFLPPPTILDVLTMPLSKEWRRSFTSQPELWRVLCLVEPFKAELITDAKDKNNNACEDDASSDSSSSFCSLGVPVHKTGSALLDKYRLLYTSFVRCMKYLSQIREDAVSGRAPSYIDYGVAGNNAQPPSHRRTGIDRNLQDFLTKANIGMEVGDLSSTESSSSEEPQQVVAGVMSVSKVTEEKKRKRGNSKEKKEKKLKIGQSMITDRLLGPSASGQPGNLELPWSCAIYSIVNWMVSFNDVEGIQTLCLKVLPFLLENEQQRQTAQRAGLTDIVLRAMLLFPDSVQLHIAAFHTVVLLARPLGGREGMLFHSSMILTGIFGGRTPNHPKSGIAIMVESMKRFEQNDELQAMSCWALVNIALAPAQKAELVRLGGINATTNAMQRHPFSAEVQFRALFALINLVIPSVRLNQDDGDSATERSNDIPDRLSEKEHIDESVQEIATIVVTAMKNFCSSEAILNRACLVLHNLSLTQEYHSMILLTPNCYQILEWTMANYRSDQVLQQSASGTLHRLQSTLSNDEDLRTKFAQQLQSQQQVTLYQAHREAMRLRQREEELNRLNRGETD